MTARWPPCTTSTLRSLVLLPRLDRTVAEIS